MRYGRIDDTPEQIGRLGGSLKDNIDKLLKLEDEIKSISNNIEKIKTLSGKDLTDATKAGKNLETFRRINDAIGRISYVNDHMDIFRDFYLNSDIYKEAVKFKPEIKNIRTDMCISVERSKGFALRSKDSYENTVKLYANEIAPKVDKLDTELVALQNKLIADVATIEESHLKAFKFLNYHTIIKTCPMSYEEAPFMVVNDERHEIVFNVPEPMCIKQVGEPDAAIVKKSVDLYLKSLVNGNLNNEDEFITVDDIEPQVAVVAPKNLGSLGLFGGGYDGEQLNSIEKVTIATDGSVITFSDLTVARSSMASCSNGTIGLFGGGTDGQEKNIIDKVTFDVDNNATDFGDLIVARNRLASCSSDSIGLFASGFNGHILNAIDKVVITTDSNATDFGDLSVGRYGLASCSDGVTGIFASGNDGNTHSNIIDKVTISIDSNATDFGDISVSRKEFSACSDGTIGLFAGGRDNDNYLNVIDQVIISTDGNATDFGDLTEARFGLASCSDGTTGLFGGGYRNWDGGAGGNINTIIDKVTIATASNATSFGDLIGKRTSLAACSGN